MNNDFFDFLIATDKVDEFLGYKLPSDIKEYIKELAQDYNNGLYSDDEIKVVLRSLENKTNIDIDLLIDCFNKFL